MFDAQLFIEEDSGNLRALQQVLHVAVEARQLLILGAELAVDRLQLLVDGLHLLLRRLELLVRGLKLFVDGLKLLGRRLHIFDAHFQLIAGGLQLRLGAVQFALQDLHGGLVTFHRGQGAFIIRGQRGCVTKRDHAATAGLGVVLTADRLDDDERQRAGPAIDADGQVLIDHPLSVGKRLADGRPDRGSQRFAQDAEQVQIRRAL